MKKWLKNLFYVPKHAKISADENILCLLLPFVAGIVICMVCLAASAWAWFSAGIQTSPQTIAAANYDISVSVTCDGNGELHAILPNHSTAAGKSYAFTLEAGTAYQVKLEATGNAPSGGYCKVVESGTDPLYTVPLLPGKSLTFTLIPEQTAVYTFTAVWGKYSGTANIDDGYTIGGPPDGDAEASAPPQEQPEAGADVPDIPTNDEDAGEYVVRSGDTLWAIAETYNTTVPALADYNGIENPDLLYPGQKIEIPPEAQSANAQPQADLSSAGTEQIHDSETSTAENIK